MFLINSLQSILPHFTVDSVLRTATYATLHELFRLPVLHRCGTSCSINMARVVFYYVYVQQCSSFLPLTIPNQTSESDDVVGSCLYVERRFTTRQRSSLKHNLRSLAEGPYRLLYCSIFFIFISLSFHFFSFHILILTSRSYTNYERTELRQAVLIIQSSCYMHGCSTI